jgi:hypothetical protein
MPFLLPDMAVKNAVTNRKPKLEFEDFNKVR